MGHKVHPKSARLPLAQNWDSKWFDENHMADYVVEDARIRATITKKLSPQAGIDRVVIERTRQAISVNIFTGRPGVIIGRAGTGINDLRQTIAREVYHRQPVKDVKLLVTQVKIPELSAAFVAQNIGQQITRRINFRRAAKQAIERTIQRGAKGIKVSVAGRLGGAEIARTEKFIEGKIPLSELRSNIGYAVYHAPTSYGVVGIKVWIYLGDLAAREDGDG